jgi:hypothetical protein
MERFVRVIRCRCGKTFAAHIADTIYEDKDWQRFVLKYLEKGCTVEIMNVKKFNLEWCICNNEEHDI